MYCSYLELSSIQTRGSMSTRSDRRARYMYMRIRRATEEETVVNMTQEDKAVLDIKPVERRYPRQNV